MRRTLLSIALAVAAATSAGAAERIYSVTDFDRIEVRGPYPVTLSTGRNSTVRAEGTAAALDRVSVDVQGRTLRIRANPSAWGGNAGQQSGPVAIRISTRELRAATVIGSGTLAIDRVAGLRVDLGLSGSGGLSVGAVDADNVAISLLGSGNIRLGGKAKQFRATVQGSGDIAAAGLAVDDADIHADGPGLIEIGAARSAKIEASGAGDVTVGGRPACTVVNRGSGNVRCGEGR